MYPIMLYTQTFGVREVSELVGSDTPVNVMEVSSQSVLTGWMLGDWAEYYEDKRCAIFPQAY